MMSLFTVAVVIVVPGVAIHVNRFTVNVGDSSCVENFAQCGGENWAGATNCCAGYVCSPQSEFYSQCLLDSDDSTTTSSSTTPTTSSSTTSSTTTSTASGTSTTTSTSTASGTTTTTTTGSQNANACANTALLLTINQNYGTVDAGQSGTGSCSWTGSEEKTTIKYMLLPSSTSAGSYKGYSFSSYVPQSQSVSLGHTSGNWNLLNNAAWNSSCQACGSVYLSSSADFLDASGECSSPIAFSADFEVAYTDPLCAAAQNDFTNQNADSANRATCESAVGVDGQPCTYTSASDFTSMSGKFGLCTSASFSTTEPSDDMAACLASL